jgi:hypothetical protein
VAVEESEVEVVDVVSRLLEARINEALGEIEGEIRSLESADDRWAHLAEEQGWLVTERMRLRSQDTDGEERGELVAFLVERAERLGPPAGASPEESPEEPPEPERLVENQPVEDEVPPPPDPGEEM